MEDGGVHTPLCTAYKLHLVYGPACISGATLAEKNLKLPLLTVNSIVSLANASVLPITITL